MEGEKSAGGAATNLWMVWRRVGWLSLTVSKIVGAVFEHQLAGGLVLSVEGVETDFASVQV